MSNIVQVINNKDRYFNGARKGQVLKVDKNRVDYYIKNGFSLVKNIEEEKNIVQESNNNMTIAQIKKELDHYGVDYSECKVKADYEKLLEEVKTKCSNSGDDSDKKSDIEEIKAKLISEAIVTEDELKDKKDNEILQIATDNGLI